MSAEASINPGQLTGPSLETKDNPKIAAEGIETGQPSTESSEYHLPQVADSPEEDSNPTKPKKKTGAIIAGAAVAAAAVTTGAILGVQSWIGLNRNDGRPNEDPNNPRPTAGAPATAGFEASPSPSATVEKEAKPIARPDMDTNPAWTNLSEENQKLFLNLLNSKEEREKLSESERLALSMKIAEYIQGFAADMFKQYNPDYREPVKASSDNSNQQILDQVSYNRALAFLLLSGGSPDSYGPNEIKDGWTWTSFAEVYTEGIYISGSDGPANLYAQVSELPDLSNANHTGYPANTASSDKVLNYQGVRSINFKETGYYGQDAKSINGEFKLVEYTPFGSAPGTPKEATWITGELLRGR